MASLVLIYLIQPIYEFFALTTKVKIFIENIAINFNKNKEKYWLRNWQKKIKSYGKKKMSFFLLCFFEG